MAGSLREADAANLQARSQQEHAVSASPAVACTELAPRAFTPTTCPGRYQQRCHFNRCAICSQSNRANTAIGNRSRGECFETLSAEYAHIARGR
jgi:hypothetical protein